MPDKKVLWLTMQKAIKSNQSINQSTPTRKTQNVHGTSKKGQTQLCTM